MKNITTIAIHQPNYLPWLGYFKKMMDCDIFVFLDDVQYEKNYIVNRNKIRTSTGSMWLTVPVNAHLDSKINEVTIDNAQKWYEKHKKSILINMSKAKYLEKYQPFIEDIYQRKHNLLMDLNMEMINYMIREFGIKTKTIFSSQLDVSGKGSDRILNICKSLNGDVYLSGQFGKNYLKLEDFEKNNIKVIFQNFRHPVYVQCYQPFVPNMCIFDLMLNEGNNSTQILKDCNNF